MALDGLSSADTGPHHDVFPSRVPRTSDNGQKKSLLTQVGPGPLQSVHVCAQYVHRLRGIYDSFSTLLSSNHLTISRYSWHPASTRSSTTGCVSRSIIPKIRMRSE
jgi:hypothetical protein